MSAVMCAWGVGCVGWFVALCVMGAPPWELALAAVSAAVSFIVAANA